MFNFDNFSQNLKLLLVIDDFDFIMINDPITLIVIVLHHIRLIESILNHDFFKDVIDAQSF